MRETRPRERQRERERAGLGKMTTATSRVVAAACSEVTTLVRFNILRPFELGCQIFAIRNHAVDSKIQKNDLLTVHSLRKFEELLRPISPT